MALDKNWTTHMVVLPPTKSEAAKPKPAFAPPKPRLNPAQAAAAPCPQPGGASTVPAGVGDFLTIRAEKRGHISHTHAHCRSLKKTENDPKKTQVHSG